MNKIIPLVVALGLNVGVVNNLVLIGDCNTDDMKPFIDETNQLISIKTEKYEEGNIVISYANDGESKQIKRVYGLPYDEIQIKDEMIFVNDEMVKNIPGNRENKFMRMKSNEYFIIGDNPNSSYQIVKGNDILSRVEGIN